jgi:hypothetical protein
MIDFSRVNENTTFAANAWQARHCRLKVVLRKSCILPVAEAGGRIVE